MPVNPPAGAGPLQDDDLAAGAQAIALAVAARLRELAPSLRPRGDIGAEPVFDLVALTLEPDDPTDPVTLAACLAAHDAYAIGRGRPGGVSPGGLALARVLVWAARAEMLGARPDVRWIGPPARLPDDVEGQVITASVVLTDGDTSARASAALVVGRG